MCLACVLSCQDVSIVDQSKQESVASVTSSSVGNVVAQNDPNAGPVTTNSTDQLLETIGASMHVEISKTFEMSCAHQLPYHNGKCAHLHGHNYRIEVTLSGEVQPVDGRPESGMVKDFSMIKDDCQVFLKWDHRNLNDYYPNPTAELLAASWLSQLAAIDPRYTSVTVWETDDCYATAAFS